MTVIEHELEETVAESGRYRAVLVPARGDIGDLHPRRERDGHVGVMWARHPFYWLGDDRYGRDAATHRDEHPEWAETSDWFTAHGPWIDTGAMVRHLVRRHGASVVLPLYLYDHSGLSISAGQNLAGDDVAARDAARRGGRFVPDPQGWDTSYVGVVFDTARTREVTGVEPALAEESLRAEVAEYDSYLTNDVWDVRIEQQASDHDWHLYRQSDQMRCTQCRTEFSPGEFHRGDCPTWDEVDYVGGYLGHDFAVASARGLLTEHSISPA